MESQFGEKIRALREQQHLYLRQVAPLLEMDTAQLSKIEKGQRQLKKEQIPLLAEILKAEKHQQKTLLGSFFIASRTGSVREHPSARTSCAPWRANHGLQGPRP